MITRNQCILFVFSSFLLSCDSTEQNYRQTVRRPLAATPQPAEADNPPSIDDTQPMDTSAKPRPSPIEENLPPYLYSLAQAQAISAIVDPYVRPPFPETPPPGVLSTRYAQLRSYVESFSNKTFLMPNLQPGRSFKVSIMQDESFNAFADGYQNILMNEGFVRNTSTLGSLEVLCHETAHSAKNHAAQDPVNRLSQEQKDLFDQFSRNLDDYMNLAYNPTSAVYTHDRARYLQLRTQWDQIGPAIGSNIKRKESEADIVGGMICAEMGLAPSDFLTGSRENNKIADAIIAAQPQPRDPTKLANREQIPMTLAQAQDFVQFFLFPVQTHPTNAEREKQIERVKPAMDKRFKTTLTLAAEWKTEIGRLKGLALTGGSDPSELASRQVMTLTSSSGEAVQVLRPLGCKHDWLRK